jgi:glycosyltransferase involved in cell wall biosynthesis
LQKPKVIRTATVALSLDYLLKGQLAFLNNHYEVVAVSGQDAHLENVAQREGVRTVNVEMQRAISPLDDLVSLWKLFWLFKREKPQIVHSITPKAGLLCMLAGKIAGVPVRMHTFTGLIFPSKQGMLQQLLIAMDRLLCWAATNIIPEGNGVKSDLIAYKITSKPLAVLANGNVNGIDIHYFSPEVIPAKEKENLRKALQLEPSDFVYVFVGRLVGDKGINELVAAFKNLSSANVKLLLVGPYEKELDALKAATLQEIEQNKNILTVGFQQDIRPYFSISDALVFPSYREGFPNVVMQAGAMGLPSIVSNINGCNEIVVEGKNGTIIAAKDTEAIFRAMKKMLSDSEYRSALEANAREMIVSRYEQKVVWEAILAEYKSIGNAV